MGQGFDSGAASVHETHKGGPLHCGVGYGGSELGLFVNPNHLDVFAFTYPAHLAAPLLPRKIFKALQKTNLPYLLRQLHYSTVVGSTVVQWLGRSRCSGWVDRNAVIELTAVQWSGRSRCSGRVDRNAVVGSTVVQ
jgi:hypothetical protein